MENSWLDDYALAVQNLESPDIFHMWCAFSALSSAAQRKVYLDWGHFQVCPNLYIVLVSEPGRCAKTTAMNVARKLVSRVDTIKTMSDSITKEKIYVAMQENSQVFQFTPTEIFTHCSLTIYASEMSVLIKSYDKDFVGSLNSLFDTINDLPFRHATKHSGSNIIPNPYLNIIGCTTPQWLAENIQEDVVEGGFSSRTIFVYSDTPNKPVPRPSLRPDQVVAIERLIIRLERITSLGGCFTIDPIAAQVYDEWYFKHYASRATNLRMAGYHARKKIHVLKIAMLRSLSIKDQLVITPEDILYAIALLDEVEKPMEIALRGIGRNKLNADMERILRDIQRMPNKKIQVKQLIAMNTFQLRDEELQECIRVMTAMGCIKETMDTETREHWIQYIEGTTQ